MKSNQKGITWVEVLVVVVILFVAILYSLPSGVSIGLTKGKMTGMLNQMRQLQVATQQMTFDSTNNEITPDTNVAWTCSGTNPLTLDEWREALSFRNYLDTNQFEVLMAYPQNKSHWFWPYPVQTNFTVYAVTKDDPDDTVLLSTANWHGGKETNLSGTVDGSRSFVVMHKGGDGEIGYEKMVADPIYLGSGGMHNYLPLK